MYQVEFAWCKVIELTSNIIAESMCTQCDAYGNEYLLLDLLLYYCKDNKEISVAEK